MKLVKVVALLVEKGADPSLTDNEGRTALHHLADPLYQIRNGELARSDVEDAGKEEWRQWREKYLEYLAIPQREYGRGRGASRRGRFKREPDGEVEDTG